MCLELLKNFYLDPILKNYDKFSDGNKSIAENEIKDIDRLITGLENYFDLTKDFHENINSVYLIKNENGKIELNTRWIKQRVAYHVVNLEIIKKTFIKLYR